MLYEVITERAVQDMIVTFVGIGLFNCHQIARLFDDADHVRMSAGVSTDIARVVVREGKTART